MFRLIRLTLLLVAAMLAVSMFGDRRTAYKVVPDEPAQTGQTLLTELSETFKVVEVDETGAEAAATPDAPPLTTAEIPASAEAESTPAAALPRRSNKTRQTKSGRIILDPVALWSPRAEPEAADAVAEAAPVAAPLWRVSASRLNVRGGPSASAPVVGALDGGALVVVLGDDGAAWVQIRAEGDRIEGYVSRRYLTPDGA